MYGSSFPTAEAFRRDTTASAQQAASLEAEGGKAEEGLTALFCQSSVRSTKTGSWPRARINFPVSSFVEIFRLEVLMQG